MKEKIFFINKLNSVELLRTSTLNRGNHPFINRFFNESELLNYILERRALFLKGTFIFGEDITGTIMKALKDEQIPYEDAQNLKGSMESYEQCVVREVVKSMEETLSDDFKLKKEILIKAYTKYQDYKKEHDLYDKFDVIRYLLSVDWNKKFKQIVVFKEFPLTKTQRLLLETVFENIIEESLKTYVKNDQSKIKRIIKAYGSVNEINQVFNIINDDHIPLNQCQIVLINPLDVHQIISKVDFLSSLSEKKINITYRFGYPLLLTRPGQMLLAIKKLYLGLYSVDAYNYLFESRFFNKHLIAEGLSDKWWSAFKKYVGWLRLSFEKETEITAMYDEKGMFDALNNFNSDIKQGIPHFINKYCLVSNNSIDQKASKAIEDTFALLKKYDLDNSKIIDILLNKNIAPTLSTPHALHITTLDYAFESNRKYTFIVGLSSDYPGRASENSLIFDEEYLKIDEKGYYCSSQIVKRKEQLLSDFISISGETYLTYPFFRLADQKDLNPSTFISNLLTKHSLAEEKGFGDDKLSQLHYLINDYQSNYLVRNDLAEVKHPKYDYSILRKKKFSPSQIANYFFGNKLLFILSVLLDINIDDDSNPFEIIPAYEKGNLLHAALKDYQKGDDKNRVRLRARQLFDNFTKKKPSDLKGNVLDLEDNFMRGLENLLAMDLGKQAECEKYYEGTIKDMFFGGTPDRIAVIDDKNVLIDYKTGTHSKHDVTNLETFIQGLIYAELVTQKSHRWKKIDEIWFVYPYEAEDKRIMKIACDEAAKETLYRCIETIKQLIISGDFSTVIEEEDDLAFKYTSQYEYLSSLYEKLVKGRESEDGAE